MTIKLEDSGSLNANQSPSLATPDGFYSFWNEKPVFPAPGSTLQCPRSQLSTESVSVKKRRFLQRRRILSILQKKLLTSSDNRAHWRSDFTYFGVWHPTMSGG